MKAVVKECKANSQLEPMVKADTPRDVIRHVLAEFVKLLPEDVGMRRSFVTSGALMRMQVTRASHPISQACLPAAVNRLCFCRRSNTRLTQYRLLSVSPLPSPMVFRRWRSRPTWTRGA